MSLSTIKPVACRIPPVTGADDSLSKVSKVTMMNRQAHPPLQVKGMGKSAATSRREMMHLTAASIGLLSLVLPASAEAGARNATMRQKIMEKFEELRQKAGLSKPKPKDEGEENTETEGKPKVQSGTKEAKPKAKDEDDEKKPKDESEEKKPKEENEAKPKVQNGGKAEAKDEKKQTQESKVVIPALPGIINGNAIETTLP